MSYKSYILTNNSQGKLVVIGFPEDKPKFIERGQHDQGDIDYLNNENLRQWRASGVEFEIADEDNREKIFNSVWVNQTRTETYEKIKKGIDIDCVEIKEFGNNWLSYKAYFKAPNYIDNDELKVKLTELNYSSYSSLIDTDIERLKENMEDSLERKHIIDVLNWSKKALYPLNK